MPSGDQFTLDGLDPRIKSDQQGNVCASWLSGVSDPTTGQTDWDASGLVFAVSRDHGETYQVKLASSFTSGVADKSELAVSSDGQDSYIVFDGGEKLDVLASHDGGVTWERHNIVSIAKMHWPTSIALTPDGTLYVTEPWYQGERTDPVVPIAFRIWRSTDQGRTWKDHVITTAPVAMEMGWCVHDSLCPVGTPHAGVAVDARGQVYVAYIEGTLKEPMDVRFIRSSDDGETWSEPQVISGAPRPTSGDMAASYFVHIAAAGNGLVYVVWVDDRTGPLNLWAKRSTDGGDTWSPDVRLSPQDGIMGFYGDYCGLAIDSRGALHVAWGEGLGSPGLGPPTASAESHGGVWHTKWDGTVPKKTLMNREFLVVTAIILVLFGVGAVAALTRKRSALIETKTRRQS